MSQRHGPASSAPSPSSPTILQVLPALKDGGVETSALEMATYIKAQGWQPLVASAGGPRAGVLAAAGIVHVTLPLASKNPWIILRNACRLARVVRQYDVSLIHARSRAPAWSAWLAARYTGVPFLTTFHGTYGLGGGWPKRFYNSVMLRGPRVIANSRFIKEHILENYDVPEENIDIAARGVDPDLFNPAFFSQTAVKDVRTELEVQGTTPLILMVGRITRWKGHALVIEALGLLQDLPWVMAFAGGVDKDSAYAQSLKTRAEELGIASRIRWLGSRNDTPRLLAASQLALSASIRPEAFGRVAIEAMAMGVPVLATGHGGSAETVVDGTTGWLVPPQAAARGKGQGLFGAFAPQAFAGKLRQALQQKPKWASMGQAARAHVLASYTVEHCCAAEMASYRKVLGLAAKGPVARKKTGRQAPHNRKKR